MLVAHASSGLLKIAALSTYWKDAEVFPDEQCGFRPARGQQSARCLLCADGKNSDELGKTPLYECFIDLQKARLRRPAVAADGARTLWRTRQDANRFPPVSRQFHADMHARLRTDDGEYSEWFDVTQGLQQGCVLSWRFGRCLLRRCDTSRASTLQ